jgi:hypothetical protein
VPSIVDAVDNLDRRFRLAPLPPANAPVFVLASGWRSGSTLMQRLIASCGRIFMWGEPYDHCGLIRRLADSTLPFAGNWPPRRVIVDGDIPASDRWIAKAYPHPRALLEAHRSFYDTLFGGPAARAGLDRWGLKGVRLEGEHAYYLRRLYPDARFVFVVRNPYDAFLSYRVFHDVRPGMPWWHWDWPDVQIRTAADFGRMWQRITASFLVWSPRLDGVLTPFEEFSVGIGIDRVEESIGEEVDRAVLDLRIDRRVGAPVDLDGVETRLVGDEESQIREVAGPLAASLGYEGPSTGGP